VMYGDWSWLGRFYNYMRYSPARVMLSNYSYRGVPSAPHGGSGSGGILPDYPGQAHRILYTKPDRHVAPGEPVFKTQKLLAGRAIASDCWARSAWHQNSRNPAGQTPGEGYYAHRDGYNVLYGDGHSAWYGDPTQTIAWWALRNRTGGIVNSSSPEGDLRFNLQSNHLTDAAVIYSGVPHNFIAQGPIMIWHNFDVSVGIDVGVDDGVVY